MKTLIQKELRENLKFAAIGLLLSIAVVVGTQLYYVDLIEGIAAGISTPQNYYYRLQPLTSGNFELFGILCCVLVAVMLGWFQVNSERHRDLWAYLVHRPVTRTTIFFSKIIAGLLLYFISVGLPLVWFVFWAKTPGHIAAPFAWRMVTPILAWLCAGTAWYFAAMLTGIRQARWYGSRGLGLVAAVSVSVLAVSENQHWYLAILLTVILAGAVWGAFHNRGEFRGQPAAGKVALTLALTPGTGAIVLGVVAIMLEIFLGVSAVTVQPYYVMSPGGVVLKIVQGPGGAQILKLDGQPLKDPDTGRPMELDKFSRLGGLPGGETATIETNALSEISERFSLMNGSRHTLWFNAFSTGRIVSYDVQTRRFTGSLGPDGFVSDEKGDGSGFLAGDLKPFRFVWREDTAQIMASSNTIYRIDFDHDNIKPLWNVPTGDAIEACSDVQEFSDALVITRSNVLSFNFGRTNAPLQWSIAFPHSHDEYPSVTRYTVNTQTNFDARSYSLWFGPEKAINSMDIASKIPIHVVNLTKSGEITKSFDLPPLATRRGPDTAEHIMDSLMPPALLSASWMEDRLAKQEMDSKALPFSFAIGVLSAIAGIYMGRRSSFSVQRQMIWAAFLVLAGIPGLLAFLSVQEWPARQRCPGCGKLRVVQNESCEHCGAAFTAPAKNGTEIFEALKTA